MQFTAFVNMASDYSKQFDVNKAISEEIARIEKEALAFDTAFEDGQRAKKINWLARTAFSKFRRKGRKRMIPKSQQIYEDLQLSRSALELKDNDEWTFSDAQSEADLRRADDEARWRHFAKFFNLPPKARLLELGMRNGHFMRFLQSQGFSNVTGIDCVKINVLYCLKHGFDVYQVDAHDLTAQFKPAAFDAIFAYHTLEHCYDPDKVLFGCNTVLKGGSGLHIEIPLTAANIRWGHCYSFKPKELAKKLKRNGFEVLDIVYTDNNFERTVARELASPNKRSFWPRIFS